MGILTTHLIRPAIDMEQMSAHSPCTECAGCTVAANSCLQHALKVNEEI